MLQLPSHYNTCIILHNVHVTQTVIFLLSVFQGIDAFLHVNPKLATKGLMMVFNPTQERITDVLSVPLYYTGLTDAAKVSERAAAPLVYQLDRHYHIQLPVDLLPLNITWFLFQ